MDWLFIGKGVHQGSTVSPCLFNFYEEHTMRNAALEEAHAGIKIAGRNINNLRYADNTILCELAKWWSRMMCAHLLRELQNCN